MKIGFTLDTLTSISGKERVVYELAKRLAKKHEVKIITFKNKVNKNLVKFFEKEGIEFVFFNYPNPFVGRLNYLTLYRKKISKLDLDIINAHGLILANAAALSKIPTVKTYHAHVTVLSEFLSNPMRWVDNFIEESFSIYFSDKIISISKYAKNQLKKLYGKNSIVIYNGVDTKKFKPSIKARRNFRERFQISNEEIVIGNIGRFVKQKNQEFLIRLLKHLNCKLILVGEGLLKKQYIFLVKKLRISSKVIFLKNLTELDEFYNAIDIYAHASLWESFGLPLLEAQSCGKPVIAFNKTAMKEVVVHNKTGFLANNEKEFLEYLKILMESKNLREKIGKNGRKFAKKFDWDIAAEKYEKTLQKLIQKRS